MTYDPTQVNFAQARVTAIQTLLQSKIGLLNTALQSNPTFAGLVGSDWGGVLTDTCVKRGQQVTTWPKEVGCLRIRVFSAMMPNQQAVATSSYYAIGQTPAQATWKTNVFVVFHPEAIRLQSVTRETSEEEDLCSLLIDWLLFGVFHTLDARTLYLPSKCLNVTPTYGDPDSNGNRAVLGYDRLDKCLITQLFSSTFSLGPGGAEKLMYALHAIHQGETRA